MAGSPPSSPRLTLAFVMNPVESLAIEGDTTFVFMLEAQQRGHEVLYVDPNDLSVSEGRVTSIVHPVTLRREAGKHVERGPARRVVFDEEVHVALQRVDPPVDADYITATQILGACRRTRVLNRPESILAYNEKLFALHFPELMAETMVSRDRADLLAFLDKLGGEMIVKPLDGKGGEGIFHVSRDDKNLHSILEQATRFGDQRAMAQRYLPAIRRGDKRVLLLEGEPIGAVLRVPADSEVRANLHVGGSAAKATIEPADQRIIDAVAPVLREAGLFFVGIDVIGEYLTEINVTSPTGVQEINALDDTCLEALVIDRIEALVREGAG